MVATFREASKPDLDHILAFMRALYAEDGPTPFSEDRAARALRELLDHPGYGQVWLIEVSHEPAGYLVLTWGYSLEFHGRDGFIDELYVAPAHRGAGIGREAMELVEREARDRGLRALHLAVDRENIRAQGLYQSSGFATRGHIIMSKRLAEDQ
jgi:ribosomal protein S18 acetylase RimI-like enzyme